MDINDLTNTPIPVALVLGGMVFIVLSFRGNGPLSIPPVKIPQIPESQKWASRSFGILFIVCGMILSLISSDDLVRPGNKAEVPTQSGVQGKIIEDTASVNPENAPIPYRARSHDSDDLSQEERDLSQEEEEAIGIFLSDVALAEQVAYITGDASIGALYYDGKALQILRQNIETVTDVYDPQGLIVNPQLDTDNSYFVEVRVINDHKIEVDRCETWLVTYHNISDGTIDHADPPRLVPQTITIEFLTSDWYVTDLVFDDLPPFCDEAYETT